MTQFAPCPEIRPLLDRFEQLKGRVAALNEQRDKLAGQIQTLTGESETIDMVTALFRQLMDAEVTDAIRSLDQLQTEGLQAVFTDQINSVHSELEIKRGKVGIQMITRRTYDNGQIVEGESDKAFGGAVSTVQSVLMRIFVILRRKLRPLLLMDETLAAIEGDYVLHMAKFLSMLSKRFSFDILLVTHDPRLVDSADTAYRIHLKEGSAQFKKVR